MNDNPILGKARIEDGILIVEIAGDVIQFKKQYLGWSRMGGFWGSTDDRTEVYNVEQNKGTKWQVQEFWKSAPAPAPWEDNTCRAPHPELPEVYCITHDRHEEKARSMRRHRWSAKEEK